jgi:hypothetical protein
MPTGAHGEKAATQSPAYPKELQDGGKTYRVLIEDVSSGIETSDSFAIKFSLLTKTPISKMKHIMHCLPATIWSGTGRARAEHILALIEEAGGRGSIAEIGSAPPPSPAEPEAPGGPAKSVKGRASCSWCGFPMKEGESRCGFCMTPVGGSERSEHPTRSAKRAPAVTRKRLICYAAVLVAGIAIIELLAR